MSKKKIRLTIRVQILALTLVSMIVLTGIITIYAINSMSSGLEEESLSGLKDVCYSVSAAYDALGDGDYSLDGDMLMKGSFNATKDEKLIDSFAKYSDVEITLFFGDTRRATSLFDAETGKRILGTKASEEVTTEVIQNGREYSATNLTINDGKYYAYYIPIKNGESVVGMIFAGKPTAKVDSIIRYKVIGVCGIALFLFLIAAVVVLFIANKIGKAVQKTGIMLDSLSRGDLRVQVDEKIIKRKDELGVMGNALQSLMEELRMIIRNLKQSSDMLSSSGQEMNDLARQTNATVDEISHAMDDISQGAVSQAEDIENATMNVGEMGNSISQIVNKVDTLNDTSEKMEQAKTEADLIITELSESSDRTYEAVKRIERQVKLTDESVTKIQEAIIMISSIAEETNLLSLNASIEAARAGESGKGFAVVASEIQKLAEESNSSAASIEQVIQNLARESQNTVDAMNQMQEIISEQQERLQDTKEKFSGVSKGIQTSRDEICVIQSDTDNCDLAREKVTDVIQNLSAVSEQNVAATEETMAAMTELNGAMGVLADKADTLKAMATDLEKDMNFFQL